MKIFSIALKNLISAKPNLHEDASVMLPKVKKAFENISKRRTPGFKANIQEASTYVSSLGVGTEVDGNGNRPGLDEFVKVLLRC